MGQAMSHAPSNANNPTLPIQGVSNMMHGLTNYAAGALPGRAGKVVAHNVGEMAHHATSPLAAGAKPFIHGALHTAAHGLDHFVPGASALAAQAGTSLATGAIGRGMARLAPAAGRMASNVMGASV
jgi:hypothetical protein